MKIIFVDGEGKDGDGDVDADDVDGDDDFQCHWKAVPKKGRGCEENGSKASVDELMVMVMKTTAVMMMILMSMVMLLMMMMTNMEIMMIMERGSEPNAPQRDGWRTSLLLGCATDPRPEKRKRQNNARRFPSPLASTAHG